jgi:hypothetical protein
MSKPPAQASTSTQSQDALDIDKILSREASVLQREVEVDRILKAFRLKCAILPNFLFGMLTLTQSLRCLGLEKHRNCRRHQEEVPSDLVVSVIPLSQLPAFD